MKRALLISVILGLMFLLDLLWWQWADRRLRPLQRAKLWRGLLGAFMGLLMVYLLGLTLARGPTRALHYYLPAGLIVAIYLWHLLVLPGIWIVVMLAWPIQKLFWPKPLANVSSKPAESAIHPSRRQMLGALVVAAPPVATIIGTIDALPQLEEFRINRQVLHLPTLPPNLDGLTIAHVCDVHVGRFTRGHVLDKIVEATNQLRPDLVMMPGDLIDFYLSDLPAALSMIRRFDPKYGVYLCQGNHDLIDDPDEFDQGVISAGVPLLRNESTILSVRGAPLQLLGVNWARAGRTIGDEMNVVAQLIRPELFSILLAHHPHNWDRAISSGIPLTLAGHSHGGQLMLTKHLGAGPILFRYFSGRYERDGKQLFVSNGVGNWFPLRLNAPAEIVHLTLRRA